MIACSVAAQPDNLGDVAIRQVMIDKLAAADNQELLVYVGDMPAGYIECYDFPPTARLARTPSRYLLRLLVPLAKGELTFVFAPGPYHAKRGAPLLKQVLLLLLVLTVRVTGGQVVGHGRSIQGSGRVVMWVQRRLLRSMNFVSMRDDITGERLGMPLPRSADLGFAFRPLVRSASQNPTRRFMVFSLRADDVLNEVDLRLMADAGRAAGLEPIFVSQVRRDDEIHRRLASLLDGEACLWENASHTAQLNRVVDVYRQGSVLVTNRLHAAIFGACLGAQIWPVGARGGGKVRSTLEGVIPLIESPNDGLIGDLTKTAEEAASHALAQAVSCARATVENLSWGTPEPDDHPRP